MLTLPLFGALIHTVFGILMFCAALFLILLVLVQRGRGGGLSGALGGMGGQSAFGTRAGDTFTYITIWASAVWILLCIAAVKFLGFQPGKLGAEPALDGRPAATAPADGTEQPLEGEAVVPDADATGAETPLPGAGDTPGGPAEGTAAPGGGAAAPEEPAQ
jgi:preprotein translocase subunit SecG